MEQIALGVAPAEALQPMTDREQDIDGLIRMSSRLGQNGAQQRQADHPEHTGLAGGIVHHPGFQLADQAGQHVKPPSGGECQRPMSQRKGQ